VVVSNSGFYTALNIDDGADSICRTGYISNNYVSGLAPGTIFYQGRLQLSQRCRRQRRQHLQRSRHQHHQLLHLLQTGTGNDFVNVQATTGYFFVNNNGGTDSVKIGSLAPFLGGTLADINGPVDVYGAGSTYLFIDNSGIPSNSNLSNATINDGEISGLSPAPIYWTSSSLPTGGVIRVDLNGPPKPYVTYTYNVLNTSDLYDGTFINMGNGADDTVLSVLASTGPLYVNGSGVNTFVSIGSLWPFLGGTLANINGPITVWSEDSEITVFINDRGDTIDRTATLGQQTLSGPPGPINTLSGLSPAPISVGYNFGKPLNVPLNVLDLYINGGSGANTYNIESTEGINSAVWLTVGSGNDVVNVGSGGSSSTLNAITAPLVLFPARSRPSQA
jgi:hypothetical protein